MQIFLRILKETGIAIVVLGLVTLVIWLLFNNQLPFLGQAIPEPVEYVEIDRADYDIEGSIEDETNPTQVFEPTNEQLKGFLTEMYISTGAPNPFTSEQAEPDVPSERVTITNTANGGSSSNDESVETDSGTKSLE